MGLTEGMEWGGTSEKRCEWMTGKDEEVEMGERGRGRIKRDRGDYLLPLLNFNSLMTSGCFFNQMISSSSNSSSWFPYISKPSDTSTWDALGSHIKPGSHLIHDGERSHGVLIRNLNLSEEVYKTAYTLNLKDEDNPLNPINRLHALSKRFMKSHGGYNRDNLQDWMNLIWFILSKPQNRYEKIRKFFNIAVCTHKRVKYRDVMSKRNDE